MFVSCGFERLWRVSLQSECCVQRGHDGRGSKESKEHERRYGRYRDPTASETHLQSALLPRSPPTGTAKHIDHLDTRSEH